MSLTDFLKGLFKDNNLVFSPKIHISINIGSGNTVTYDQRKQLANIDVSRLSDEKKVKLQKLLKHELSTKKPLLDSEYKARAEDYKQKIELPENQDILQFFTPLLPSEDITILRAALYIRTMFKRHGDLSTLKSQLMSRYGVRARNIANLCSAGYFESWIRPLYEEMQKRPGFTKEKFLEIYEEIVVYSPFAFFVNRTMSEDEIINQILAKIEQMKKYGIKTLNIHGIGYTNVIKIRNALVTIEKTTKFTKSIIEEDNVIVARLCLDSV